MRACWSGVWPVPSRAFLSALSSHRTLTDLGLIIFVHGNMQKRVPASAWRVDVRPGLDEHADRADLVAQDCDVQSGASVVFGIIYVRTILYEGHDDAHVSIVEDPLQGRIAGRVEIVGVCSSRKRSVATPGLSLLGLNATG